MELLIRFLNIIKAVVNYSLNISYLFLIPLKQNKYFCISMMGNDYGDNIKCLADYISQKEPNSEIVWGFTSRYYKIVDCSYKKVKLYSFRFYYHIQTSKYILVNQGVNHKTLIKRRGQILLQTWHGTALKKIGSDIKLKKEEKYLIDRWFRPNPENYYVGLTDIWISGSRFMSKIYREKFAYKKPIYEIGTPRNDIFFKDNATIQKRVRQKLKIQDDISIILYAPTFRADRKLTHYDIDHLKLIEALEKRFGRKFVFLIRLHPIINSYSQEFRDMFPSDVINASSYPDMQELLCASDILVTDYSSSIFDFMFSFRPVFLYLSDKQDYENIRGFYFEIDSLPFAKIKNNSDIENSIKAFDNTIYKESLIHFMKEIGSVEKGNAIECTYNIIKGNYTYKKY